MTPEDFRRHCERVGRLTGQEILKACSDDIEQTLHLGIEDNFAYETSADGVGWPARKRQGDGHPLLNESGALKAAATQKGAPGNISKVEGDTLTVGVDPISNGSGGVPGARRHHRGDAFEGPGAMPTRPFMEVSEKVVDYSVEQAADAIIEIIKKL